MKRSAVPVKRTYFLDHHFGNSPLPYPFKRPEIVENRLRTSEEQKEEKWRVERPSRASGVLNEELEVLTLRTEIQSLLSLSPHSLSLCSYLLFLFLLRHKFYISLYYLPFLSSLL